MLFHNGYKRTYSFCMKSFMAVATVQEFQFESDSYKVVEICTGVNCTQMYVTNEYNYYLISIGPFEHMEALHESRPSVS
jgi:hypothetical protein